jgi:thioredoxin
MRKSVFGVLSALFLVVSSCSTGQSNKVEFLLGPQAFQEKFLNSSGAILLDVRTPSEFSEGALANARNIDWNGSDFKASVSNLDKSKPIFVYCLSGGRSASAARELRKTGFTTVYELEGGILKWRSLGFPEGKSSTQSTVKTGISVQQFEDSLASRGLVLVDFFAPWCGPCKKMKPTLDKISRDYKGKVFVWRIDVDENPELAKSLKIDALPTVAVYNSGKAVSRKMGYLTEKEMLNLLGF